MEIDGTIYVNFIPIGTTPQTIDVIGVSSTPSGITGVVSEPINWDDVESINKAQDAATDRTIFAQNAAPTENFQEGDLWFDTDDSNKLYRADSTKTWISVQDGSIFSGEWEDILDGSGTIPDDNATDGATAGDNLFSSGVVVLEDEDVIKLLQALYGDGDDGNVTYNGGGTSTLTADLYCDNCTISNSTTLNPDGYRIFVKDTLSIEAGSLIDQSGGDGGNGTNGAPGSTSGNGGVAGSAPSAVGGGYYPAGEDGKAGGAGGQGGVGGQAGTAGSNGTGGDSTTTSVGANGGDGGQGAAGGAGEGAYPGGSAGNKGTKGTASAVTVPRNSAELTTFIAMGANVSDGSPIPKMGGSAGSGSGGGAGGGGGDNSPGATGGGGGAGGSSGASGGIIGIFAKTVTNAGTITVAGGTGGDGGDGGDGDTAEPSGNTGGGGGGGEGAGGAGGVLLISYNTLTNTGTLTAAKGAAGSGGTGGTAVGTGTNGSNAPADSTAATDGTTIYFQN